MTTSKPNYKRARPALGTLVVLSLQDLSCEEAEKLFASAFAELARLEKIFNFFDETSELSALNRTSGVPTRVSPELERVLRSGAQIEQISGGAFRLMPKCSHAVGACYSFDQNFVTKSSCRFDLGGIAKGAIVDFVFEHLLALAPQAKITVNAGGDLRSSESQSIEIRVPALDAERRFGVEIPAGAIATSSVDAQGLGVGTASARYENKHRDHALKVGHRTASVVAQTCAVADAWTKVALFSGEKLGAELGVLAQYRFDQDGMPL